MLCKKLFIILIQLHIFKLFWKIKVYNLLDYLYKFNGFLYEFEGLLYKVNINVLMLSVGIVMYNKCNETQQLKIIPKIQL